MQTTFKRVYIACAVLLFTLVGCTTQQPAQPPLPPALRLPSPTPVTPPLPKSVRPLLASSTPAAPTTPLVSVAPLNSVTLAWDKSPDPSVVGYNLYWGVASQTYTNLANAGSATNYTVTNLTKGVTYYFAATDYTLAGLESSYSAEVSYTLPLPIVQSNVVVAIVTLVDGSTNNSAWTNLYQSPSVYFTNTIDPSVVKFWRTRSQVNWFYVKP